MTHPTVPEITPADLARAAESGEDIQVLDVRPPPMVESGHVDLVADDRFFNMVGSQLAALADPADLGIRRDAQLAVICARGNASRNATAFLQEAGSNARSVVGGMASWMMMSVERPLPAPPGFDHLVQFDRVGKGSLAYLLAAGGDALIIDPPRDFSILLDAAERLGVRIVGVADTHVHADFISGSPAMSARLGIPYYLHPADHVYPYDGTPGRLSISELTHGQTLTVGVREVLIVHTPGHTEGSVTFLASSAAFTGDFIFVESIGRPDLGGKVEEWVGGLWNSVVAARDGWDRDTMIYPAHYSVERERNEDRTIGRTFGEILDSGGPASMVDEVEFVEWVVSRKAAFPEAYRHIKAVNVGLLQVTDEEADVLEVGKNECAVG